MIEDYCCDKMRYVFNVENAIHKRRFIEGVDMGKEVYYCYTKLLDTPLRLLIFDHCPFCGKKV